MTPADIRRQVVGEELDLSLDGRLAIVARRSVRGNRYVTHLYAIPLDRARVGRPRQLTSGVVRDGRPRLSPDGTRLVFVRRDPTKDDEPASAVVMTVRTGAQRRIRRRGFGSVGEVAWAPDGRRLAFTAEVDPPRFLVGPVPLVGGHRRRKPGKVGDDASPVARRIDRADWRWDGEGHQDRWSHLFVVEPRSGATARQVTTGDWGVSEIAWAPDGRWVAFVADRSAAADLRPRPSIWAVDVSAIDDEHGSREKSQPREIMAPAGYAHRPVYSPDGRWLAAIGVLEPAPLDDVSPTILTGPSDGSAAPWALAPDLDRPIGNWADTDLNGWMVSGQPGPFWRDPTTIVATVTDRGRSQPVPFLFDPVAGAARHSPTASPREAPPGRGRTSPAMPSAWPPTARSLSSARSGHGQWS